MARPETIYEGKRHSVEMAIAKIEDATTTLKRKRPLSEEEQSLADQIIQQLGEALDVSVQVPWRVSLDPGRCRCGHYHALTEDQDDAGCSGGCTDDHQWSAA